MVRVAINGFGRIGRMIFGAGFGSQDIEFVAINDLTTPENLAYLLKYDSVHRIFPHEVASKNDALVVGGKEIKVLSEKDPAKLPWKDLGIDVVLECTGFFRKKEQVELHLQAGARKAILSAPPKGDGIKTIVMGVNEEAISPDDHIISNASCTTNSLAPIVKALHNEIGIEQGFMTTVHSYTADQKLVDAPHPDFRRGRSAAVSIVPTSTGAAVAVTKVIPELAGKLDGLAFRVPTPEGSVTDFVAVMKRETTKEEILQILENYSKDKLKGILQICHDPIVSSDVIGNTHSSILDVQATMVQGKMVKAIAWYDNEVGYSNRMIDLVKLLAGK